MNSRLLNTRFQCESFIAALVARGKPFTSWKERMDFVMEFLNTEIGNNKEHARVINEFINKYLKKKDAPEWAKGKFLDRLEKARQFFDLGTPPDEIEQCVWFIEALVERGKAFVNEAERTAFVKNFVEKYLGHASQYPLGNFIRTNLKNNSYASWIGNNQKLKQKIAIAREYYRLKMEYEQACKMTEAQQIQCENFVERLVRRRKPFARVSERKQFVAGFIGDDRELAVTINTFIMNYIMTNVFPRWFSRNDEFNRRLEIARRNYTGKSKQRPQRKRSVGNEKEGKIPWKNDWGFDEDAPGGSSSSLKRRYNIRCPAADDVTDKRRRIDPEVEDKPGTMDGRVEEEELTENGDEYNVYLGTSSTGQDNEDGGFIWEGSPDPETDYEAEAAGCSLQDLSEALTPFQQIQEDVQGIKRDMRELQGEMAELKKSNANIEQQCSLILQLLTQRGHPGGTQQNPGDDPPPNLPASLNVPRETLLQTGYSSRLEGIVPEVTLIKEEGQKIQNIPNGSNGSAPPVCDLWTTYCK